MPQLVCAFFFFKKDDNRINESCHCKVLVRQSACPKKSLSKFFYAREFRVQQLEYEKLGMDKLPWNELTLSLSLSLSLSLPLSLFLKQWKLLVTVDNSWQFILVILLTLGMLMLTVLPCITHLRKVIIFTSNFYFIILYFWQVRRPFTPEFNNKKYTKEELGFSNVSWLFPHSQKVAARVFGRIETVFFCKNWIQVSREHSIVSRQVSRQPSWLVGSLVIQEC